MRCVGLLHQSMVRRIAESFNHNQFTFLATAHNSLTFSIGLNGSDPVKCSYGLKESIGYCYGSTLYGNNLSWTVNGDKEISGKFLKSVQNAHDHKEGTDADNDSGKTYGRNDIDNPETFLGKTKASRNPQPCSHTCKNNIDFRLSTTVDLLSDVYTSIRVILKTSLSSILPCTALAWAL